MESDGQQLHLRLWDKDDTGDDEKLGRYWKKKYLYTKFTKFHLISNYLFILVFQLIYPMS